MNVKDFNMSIIISPGIIMVLSWPLLVVIAIFFAAWMKPAMPNGQWFQVHTIFTADTSFSISRRYSLHPSLIFKPFLS